MFVETLSASIGALMNRIRGGMLNDWLGNTGIWALISGKTLNDIVFAAWFTFLFGITSLGFENNEPIYEVNFSLTAFSILFGAMWLGRLPGWGTYIGGMIDKMVKPEKEIEQIDELVLSKTNYPVLRNTVALSLRGLMWSIMLAVGFFMAKVFAFPQINMVSVVQFSLCGLLMGPTYLITMEFIEKVLKKNRGLGWSWGEHVWGFVLWGLAAGIVVAS